MTRERIEDMREVVLPFVKKRLLETNYEGLGEADAKEFEREFNEILNLAIKALEQEPTTKNNSSELEKNSKKLEKDFGELVEIDLYSVIKQKYIEREVLDKIRAEIKSLERFEIRGEVTPLVNVDRVLEIIDKAESEVT